MRPAAGCDQSIGTGNEAHSAGASGRHGCQDSVCVGAAGVVPAEAVLTSVVVIPTHATTATAISAARTGLWWIGIGITPI